MPIENRIPPQLIPHVVDHSQGADTPEAVINDATVNEFTNGLAPLNGKIEQTLADAIHRHEPKKLSTTEVIDIVVMKAVENSRGHLEPSENSPRTIKWRDRHGIPHEVKPIF